MPDLVADSFPPAPIVIIGGGFSGALLAARLLEAPGRRHVVVVEDGGPPGRGLAYSGRGRLHLVNANAGRMSADSDDPAHFTRWLEHFVRKGGWPEAPAAPADDLFAPRSVYGLYVQDLLAEAVTRNTHKGSRFEWVPARAVDVIEGREGFAVHLLDGATLEASAVVLATGIFSKSRPAGRSRSRRVIDPWNLEMEDIGGPEASVAIIGSGLTMVDAVVSLEAAGHRGPIEVISRHGLRPHVRRLPREWPDFLADVPDGVSLARLARAVRAECLKAVEAGEDWQAPLDMVRPHIGRLWHASDDRQRRAFVRHVRPFWESHHHRAPPVAAALVDRLVAEGRLRQSRGTVVEIDSSHRLPQVRFRPAGSHDLQGRSYDAVIVSSGIDYDWRLVQQPLPQNLLRKGMVRPGPLGLGIDAGPDYRVVGRDGTTSERLFALGPPLRGLWWESTAVVDIARQARELAIWLAESRLSDQNAGGVDRQAFDIRVAGHPSSN